MEQQFNLSGINAVLMTIVTIYTARHWFSTLNTLAHLVFAIIYDFGTIIIINFTEWETEAYN